MYDLDTTADVLLMRPPANAATQQLNETAIEAVLVSAALEGDREGFGRLYGLYAPLVHGILLARVPRGEVDDLVQDIFLHALRKLHTLRDWAAFVRSRLVLPGLTRIRPGLTPLAAAGLLEGNGHPAKPRGTGELRAAVEDPALEWKLCAAAIPAALALGLAFHAMTPGLQRIFFGMPMPEYRQGDVVLALSDHHEGPARDELGDGAVVLDDQGRADEAALLALFVVAPSLAAFTASTGQRRAISDISQAHADRVEVRGRAA